MPAPTVVHYIRTSDGRRFIPNGLNLCFPRFITDEAEGLALYRRWIESLAAAGGNFLRLWLGHGFFDLEPATCGVFSAERAARLRTVLDYAQERNIKVKLTIDHFRSIVPENVAESFPGSASFDKPLYHPTQGGVARDMTDYLDSPAGRTHFCAKLDFLAAEFSQHPAIFAWELWNEMNAVKSDRWQAWTVFMLDELRARFPETLCLQSLGSFDCSGQQSNYEWYATLPQNDIVQVHRYIDLAPGTFAACHGPVDIMAATAVRELRALAPEQPVILAESGAVEPGHRAPFELYEKDVTGTILHDVLFAAFFAGSAGPGQIWHWDLYVDRHNLWWHYRQFAAAIEGINPTEESFVPHLQETPSLRAYELRGTTVSLYWLRDAHTDWRTELRDGYAPTVHKGCAFQPARYHSAQSWESLDPWESAPKWKPLSKRGNSLHLPPWKRSILLRCLQISAASCPG